MGAGHGHADHRQRGLSRQDPPQMGRHPGHGNDDLDPPGRRVPGISLNPLGGAVGRATTTSKAMPHSLSSTAAGSTRGQSEALPKTMPTSVGAAIYLPLFQLRGRALRWQEGLPAPPPLGPPNPAFRDWGGGVGGGRKGFRPLPSSPRIYPARRRPRISSPRPAGRY